MRTQKQIEASRANGKRSRGPITDQGKFNSSHNALKHGLRARILFMEPEHDPRFRFFLDAAHADYDLVTDIDKEIARTLAIANCREFYIPKLEVAANRMSSRAQNYLQ